jgi:hypothetical protein
VCAACIRRRMDVHIDDDLWPLVVATISDGAGADSLEVFARYFDECFARGERFALIVDTRDVHHIPDALWRKRLAEWMNEPSFRQKNARLNVGSATILTSAPVRATLTALQWLWKPPSPQHYASDMRDAADWCMEKLRAGEVPIGARLAVFHASLSRRAAGSR